MGIKVTLRTVVKPGQAATGSGSKPDHFLSHLCAAKVCPQVDWVLVSPTGVQWQGEKEFLPWPCRKPDFQVF